MRNYIYSILLLMTLPAVFWGCGWQLGAGGNAPPVAVPGADQSVLTGDKVVLNGSASSDPDGNPLTYAWSLISKPASSVAAITNATSANASFTADQAGEYKVQLIVNDGKVDSAAATLVVTATTGNRPPIANAGPDQTVTVGTQVKLDGKGSSDPDNNPITYSWSLSVKPNASVATIANSTNVAPSMIPDVVGSYTIQLIVNDGTVNSAPDTMTVTATAAN